MKTKVHMKNGTSAIKRLQVLPLLFGLLFAGTAGIVNAQTAAETPSRAQVKMERDEFIKTHRYDQTTESWILKPEFEAPAGMKSRTEMKAARDEFLRNSRWDTVNAVWVPLKAPRDLSKMSREEMRKETQNFTRTHNWDATNDVWVLEAPRKKK